MDTIRRWKLLKIVGLILLSAPIAGVLSYGVYQALEVLTTRVGRAETLIIVACAASCAVGAWLAAWGALREEEEKFFERATRRAELLRGEKPPVPPPPTKDPDYVGPRPARERI